MRRSEYEDVPNRIIPPYMPLDTRRPEYDRSSRVLIPQPIRQPLLGEAPIDSYRQSYSQNAAFNGPVVETSRRRGFDKGPSGEDYAAGRLDGRQPLLRNPKLAVEHVGGDMDISRSRSSSPELVNARSVRDDRRRDRGERSKRSPLRTRRSRSRSHDRDYSRSKPRDRPRSRQATLLHDQIRDGIVHVNDNYYEFLIFFMDELNQRIENSMDHDVQGSRKAIEEVTPASNSEKDRIVLPPEFDNSDREKMLHCDTTISGLPASIFFGSGYGPRAHYAKHSAAKDLVDKCHRIGVINSELHAAIGDWNRLDRSFKSQFKLQIGKAVNAVILLIKKMALEHLPPGFMTLRHLPADLIDRFKTMLRMVMIDVYYQGIETSSTVVPSTLETGYDSHSSSHSSRPRDSDMRRHEPSHMPKGPSAEEMIRLKEKEMKEKMEQELQKKRIEMEQEIRKQVIEEERAKIRAELEMEKKIELMKIQQQQYQLEKEKKEMEEQQKKAAAMKQVEDEFNAMVEQLDQKFTEVRSRGLNHILEMVYNSATFNTIQAYSNTPHSFSNEQKTQLVKDLKELLDGITKQMTLASVQSAVSRIAPMLGGFPPVAPEPVLISSYQFPQQPMQQPPMQMPQQVLPQQVLPPPQFFNQISNHNAHSVPSSSSSSRRDETRRVTLGNMHLRALNNAEQRRLAKGDKVIAQDAKTGNWSLGTVVKVTRDNRVTLTVGNATWKKNIDELYKEDKGASAY